MFEFNKDSLYRLNMVLNQLKTTGDKERAIRDIEIIISLQEDD